MVKATITFQPDGKRVETTEDKTILDAILLNGIDISSVCGGKGICGKCKIIPLDETAVTKITEKEKKILSKKEIQNGVRLACLTKVLSDVVVKIPQYSRTGKQRLQVEGIETPIRLDPNVKKVFNKEENTTVVKWNEEIITKETGDTSDRLFGYAVDIGTTKLAGYLVDLTTAKVVAAGSLMNPQIPYGEDVIARLNYKDPQKLHDLVIEGLNEILDELMEKTGVKSSEIYEMTVVGNTVMHHLFLNINPRSLGIAPYTPIVREAKVLEGKSLNMKIHPKGKIYTLPVIAGYVGADTLGVVLATGMHEKKEISLALDIGTNTEVVLGNKDKLYACSCASGPAFEGAHIKHGMRAASGAIEKIEIDPDSLEISYKTIDDEPPIGICGSAFIDLLAEMLKARIIDVVGRFNKNLDNSAIRKGPDGWELVIVPSNKNEITFTQKDLIQLILAKAAMQTGVLTLMRNFNISKEDIDKLFIAGAFGSHVNKVNARIIGIIPEIDLKKVESVGNAAGTGARMTLVSKRAKAIVEELSDKIEYIELAIDKNFQNTFLNSNSLPYAD
ncbi:MAG: ASKHA domain-containing protein, partial [Candidatus Helarchaeota archaeon]